MTRKVLSGSGHTVKMYLVRIIGDSILASVEDGISLAHGSQPRDLSKNSCVWIPLPVVRLALPSLVKPEDQVVSVSDIIDLTEDDEIDTAGHGIIDLTGSSDSEVELV